MIILDTLIPVDIALDASSAIVQALNAMTIPIVDMNVIVTAWRYESYWLVRVEEAKERRP